MVGDVQIVVVEIRNNKVRLGVEAPKDVPVHRKEVYDAVHRADSASLSAPRHSIADASPDCDNIGPCRLDRESLADENRQLR